MNGLQTHQVTFRDRLQTLSPFVRPRPLTDKLWLDCFYVLMIATFQLAILPSFLPGRMTVDLLTPWLTIGFIRGPLARTLITAFLGAVLLETFSAVPAGLYITTYFVIGVSIFLFRRSLSWRISLPWFASFFGAATLVVLFESFVIYLSDMQATMTPLYFLVQAARVVIATAFGLYLVEAKWKTDEREAA